jgi:hypothetical protein
VSDLPAPSAPLTDAAARALLAAFGGASVASFLDVAGTAPALALALWRQWRCPLSIACLSPKGTWDADRSAYVMALRAGGVPQDQILLIKTPGDLRPYDLIANLTGFGDSAKIALLSPHLPQILHPGSRMLTDIRKGSGSYPELNRFGKAETLTEATLSGKTVTRALFQADGKKLRAAPKPTQTPDKSDWAELARDLAGPDGFFRDNGRHSFLFVPRSDTLVVTFDNLDIAMEKRVDRRPWGYSFIEKQGWSMLGAMANGWTWYRDPWVWDQFDELAASGFFARFQRVVFYGASMGGYAAAAFSAACPGADVVAISPQSTLDKTIVPWETRYRTAWGQDYSGRYGDAAKASATARRVILLYDPFEKLDRGHAERFTAPNVTFLRALMLGHRLGSSLLQMGILQEVTLAALNGTLTEPQFYRLLRARHQFARYQRELFKRCLDRNRPDLAARVARWALARGDSRFFRRALASL